MTAALSIKTPVMTLPLLPPLPPLPDPERGSPVDALSKREKAAVLQSRLRRLSFAEILQGERLFLVLFPAPAGLTLLHQIRRGLPNEVQCLGFACPKEG